MTQKYRQIFQAKGAYAFSLSGFFARMPIAMITLSIITMYAVEGKSYKDSGFLAGSYILANACLTPFIARFADRYGQAKIARPATLIAFIALCLFLVGVHYDAPFIVLFITIIFAGFMPSYGAFVRARWSALYRGSENLRTAFAFETIVDEVIFMTGPIIAVQLANHLFSSAGLLATAIILLVGGFVFLSLKHTEPPIHQSTHIKSTSVIRLLPIQILFFILFCIGIIFGVAEIMSVALADKLDLANYAAWPLAMYALGSFVSGIIYSLIPTKTSLQKQLLYYLIAAAATTLPLLFVTNLWELSMVLFIAGAACSPTIIISISLIESIAPVEKLTEGMTWAATGMFMGFAAGSAIAGTIIENYGTEQGFIISVIGGFTALFLTIIGNKYIKPKSHLHSIKPK